MDELQFIFWNKFSVGPIYSAAEGGAGKLNNQPRSDMVRRDRIQFKFEIDCVSSEEPLALTTQGLAADILRGGISGASECTESGLAPGTRESATAKCAMPPHTKAVYAIAEVSLSPALSVAPE